MKKNSKYLLFVFPGITLLIAICLRITFFQQLLLSLGEFLISRKLRKPEIWTERFLNYSVHLFVLTFILLSIILIILFYKKIRLWYIQKKKRNDIIISCLFGICVFSAFFLPFLLFGENVVINPHDGLDSNVPVLKYVGENNLLFDLDSSTKVMDNISSVYISPNLLYAINCVLPSFAGYSLQYAIAIIIGFFSMFLLLSVLFKTQSKENLIIIVLLSLSYAVLPACLPYRWPTAALPFIFFVFIKLLTTKQKRWYFFIFIYTYFAELSSVGIFVCGFWLLFTLIECIKNRKINTKLFVGFYILCFGVILFNYKLFYMRLFVHDDLNRDHFLISPSSFLAMLKTYLFAGYYHSATIQDRIVNKVLLGTALFMTGRCGYCKYKNKPISSDEKFYIKGFVISLGILVFSAIIAALSDADILDKIICVLLPFMTGLNLSRIFMIAKLAVYISFAFSIIYIASFKKLRLLAYVLCFVQICNVFITPAMYNDSFNSWRANLDKNYSGLTYGRFYSENQFNEIKNAIHYDGESCCALGLDPAVLLYNKFNPIDGYVSVYPYKDMLHWHNLMIPEFERNEVKRNYFDSWGGRRYIYNRDLDEGNIDNVNLYVDMDILRHDFNCKYIFSTAVIQNAGKIGIKLKNISKSDVYWYTIYIYQVL